MIWGAESYLFVTAYKSAAPSLPSSVVRRHSNEADLPNKLSVYCYYAYFIIYYVYRNINTYYALLRCNIIAAAFINEPIRYIVFK